MRGVAFDLAAAGAGRVRLEATGPRRIFTPSVRKESTLRRNGARSARAVLTKGSTMVRTPWPVVSARTPGQLFVQAILSCSSPKSAMSLRVPPRAEI